jgi:hypothetical protein
VSDRTVPYEDWLAEKNRADEAEAALADLQARIKRAAVHLPGIRFYLSEARS